MSNYFKNRKIIIATKHGKEKVIAPILERELGIICISDPDLDTDLLGTFTGEIERSLDPLNAAREKCIRAMERNQCDLAIASEGSFGPHPSMYFVSADDELIVMIDSKNKLEFCSRTISTQTNFNGKVVHSEAELMSFAASVMFPSHGLIIRPSKEDMTDMAKGITDEKQLKQYFAKLFASNQSVYVETDMRAMFNPSRMLVIEQATQKLVSNILSICPNCASPGFSITDYISGLPCSLCNAPTRSTLSYIYTCQHCQHRKEEQYPHQKTKEDPMYCDYCNP